MTIYDTLYLFFNLGDKVFKNKLMVEKTKYGTYKILDNEVNSAYKFFKFDPPTDLTLDTIPIEPYKQIRYYPMFSKNDNFDKYIEKLNQTKKDEIEIYEYTIETLKEQLEKEYICEEIEKQNSIE